MLVAGRPAHRWNGIVDVHVLLLNADRVLLTQRRDRDPRFDGGSAHRRGSWRLKHSAGVPCKRTGDYDAAGPRSWPESPPSPEPSPSWAG